MERGEGGCLVDLPDVAGGGGRAGDVHWTGQGKGTEEDGVAHES